MPDPLPTLYRGGIPEDFPEGMVKDGKAVMGALYPTFYPKPYADRSGRQRSRPADVDIINGVVQPGGGTSLLAKADKFIQNGWHVFVVPKRVAIPPSLTVVFTNFSSWGKADHYQIEVRNPMTVTAFQGALDNLARSCIEVAVRSVKGKVT